MSGLVVLARRHQLVLFFVLAYALSWWAWVWYRLDPGNVDAPILPVGPFLAALVMLALIGGGRRSGTGRESSCTGGSRRPGTPSRCSGRWCWPSRGWRSTWPPGRPSIRTP
ncbi:MAG TPA: hypothetical protein VNO83_12655, partial [Pseudonocardia sp.]|nr:hypothetical protein [Pseudonocardia sp.]